MAATDARPVPRKNAAFRFYFAVRKNDGTLITTWAGQDSEVSLDGASFSDCANEATEIGTTGCGYVDFTSSEMNADCVVYKLTVTNTDALPLVFTFFPEEVGDYRADVVQVGGDTQSATDLKDFADAGYDPSTNKVQGVVLVDTITTYTGNTPQTGDAFSRIGATGSGLTSLAPSATALSTVTWSGTLATNLGTTNTTVAANLNATITSRMATYTQPTGFLAATFPTTVASTTNITAAAGIQVQSIVANAITASALATDAVAEIWAGSNGSGLSAIPWNAAWDAEVQSEVQDAIEANHLDHLFAADYDPASKPGVSTALMNELIGNDGGVSQFTANSLELAPTGGSAPTVSQIRQEMDDNSTKLASILDDTNELQTDWANGGRLDLILDIIAADTTTDIPALIAALNNISIANVSTGVTTALTTALTEGYRATNATGSVRDLLYEINQGISEFVITSTTKTVKKLDGSTTAKVYTLNDGTTPTGITETT